MLLPLPCLGLLQQAVALVATGAGPLWVAPAPAPAQALALHASHALVWSLD